MKKTFLLALISALAITMTACGKVEDETSSKAETTAATAETTITTTVLEETETTTSTGTSATTSKTTTSATTTAKTSTTKKATTTKKSSNQSSSGGNVVNNGGNSNNNYSNNSNNNQSYNNSSGGNSSNNQTTQARTTTQAPMTTTRKPQTTTQAVQTTQAQPQNHLTQSDMDNLKNELQEYSNNKYCGLNGLSNVNQASWYAWSDGNGNIVDYVTGSIAPCDFNSYLYSMSPNWCGYDDIDPILYQPNELYMAMSAAMSYNELVNIFKEYIDYEYSERPDAHYVVYIENCPNGKDVDGFYYPPCWVVYLLY